MQRLFAQPMTPESVVALGKDGLLAERLDAFVGRFGRLQDKLAGPLNL